MSISLYASELLLEFLWHQRTVHNYLFAIEKSSELQRDITSFFNSEQLEYSLAQSLNRIYIPDDPTPTCCTGTWIYHYKLIHRNSPNYQARLVAKQPINKCSGFVARLHMLAVHLE